MGAEGGGVEGGGGGGGGGTQTDRQKPRQRCTSNAFNRHKTSLWTTDTVLWRGTYW